MPRVHGYSLLKNSASTIVLTIALSGAAAAGALPGHGHFTNGQGSIAKSHGMMSVDQVSRTGIVDWKTFSIGKANAVTFNNNGGATLNLVRNGNISRIAGSLQSNGSVYLINRSGVVVSNSGRIDTQGGFAASGRGIDQTSFGEDKRLRFTGHGKGNVIDHGTISANNVALIAGGRLNVTGSIAAKGRVETSGAHIGNLAGASIGARNWLIDPKNLKVTSSAASTISSSLSGGSNVTLKTTNSSCGGPGTCSNGPGDITIAAPIAWTGGAKLTLSAWRSVNIDNSIHAKGPGDFTVVTAHGGDLFFGAAGSATFDVLSSNVVINGNSYTLEKTIHGLAVDTAANPTDFFALANNVNASGTVYSAAPIGTFFAGTFEGLGHTISHLTIFDLTDTRAGLFKSLNTTGVLRDITLSSMNVKGLADNAYVGGLVAASKGTITGVRTSGDVTGGEGSTSTPFGVGGVVGYSAGSGHITNVASSATVVASYYTSLGGLVGYNKGKITDSHASGLVEGDYDSYAGGLVGWNEGTLTNVYATGDVNADYGAYAGGLAGYSNANVSNAHAAGDVFVGYDGYAGGLIGYSEDANVTNTFATGNVTADDDSYLGGLIGYAENGAFKSDHASGTVNGQYEGYAGGLIGVSDTITVTSSYATGDVNTDDSDAGGLIGYTDATTIDKSHATGLINGGAYSSVGGLVGYVDTLTPITNSHATGRVVGGEESYVGGLVGYIDDTASPISNSYATGDATTGYEYAVGGLVGYNTGSILDTVHASGHVIGGYESYTGGLVGENYGTVRSSYATGKVEGGYDADTGGLVGYQGSNGIIGSYATGAVNAGYDSYVGGLVGDFSGGQLKNSHAKGAVYGGEEAYAGGLVGYLDSGSTVHNSYATGDVTSAYDGYAGGLVSDNDGIIELSYATGDVYSGYDSYGGGLVGYGDTGSSVDQSFATGDVTGSDAELGGFIGDNYGAITNSYARGEVDGDGSTNVGGFVGYNESTGTVAKSYATGLVSGGTTGGFAGFNNNATGFTQDYFDKTTSGTTTGVGGGTATGVTAKTTAQLKNALLSGFSGTIWGLSSSKNGGFPFLKNNQP